MAIRCSWPASCSLTSRKAFCRQGEAATRERTASRLATSCRRNAEISTTSRSSITASLRFEISHGVGGTGTVPCSAGRVPVPVACGSNGSGRIRRCQPAGRWTGKESWNHLPPKQHLSCQWCRAGQSTRFAVNVSTAEDRRGWPSVSVDMATRVVLEWKIERIAAGTAVTRRGVPGRWKVEYGWHRRSTRSITPGS